MNAGPGFDVLRQELGEDHLLGEEFGADGEVGVLILAAAAKETRKKENNNGGARNTLWGRREEGNAHSPGKER